MDDVAVLRFWLSAERDWMAEKDGAVRGSPDGGGLMRAPSLRVNVLWALAGNGVSAVSSWLMLVVLAKLATVETVGVLGVAQAIGIPISALLSLKLQQVQVTDARRDYSFGEYHALKMLASAVMVLCVAGAAFGFYSGETAVVTTVMGIGYAIIEVREMFLAVMQKAERMDQMSISRALLGVASLALFGVFYWASRSLAVGVCGMLVGRLVVLWVYDVPIARRLLALDAREARERGVAPHWHWAGLWRLTKLSAPLGLVGGVGMLFMSIPRLTLDNYCGMEAVGYYAAVSSLPAVGVMLVGAICQTVSPRLARYYDENRRAFWTLLLKTVWVSAALGGSAILVSVLCGRWVLTLLFTPAYGAQAGLLIELMVTGLVLYLFSCMNVGLTAARQFGVQFPIYALAALACGVSSYVLIPRMGTHGAAWSVLICYVVGFVGCLIALVLADRRNPVRAASVECGAACGGRLQGQADV
jgi:O-antigen/teichoic acid export membrane protein